MMSIEDTYRISVNPSIHTCDLVYFDYSIPYPYQYKKK